MKQLSWCLFAIILDLAGSPQGHAASLQVHHSEVEFLAIGRPSAIKIRGKGQELKSELQWKEQKLTGFLSFQLNSLDTGIELRTEHMKNQYLEIAKHPTAELTLKPLPLPQNLCQEDIDLNKAYFEATLKLHGVEKDIAGDFDLKAKNGRGQATVRFPIIITDFQIEIPVYMGIKVADKIENLVTLEWACSQ